MIDGLEVASEGRTAVPEALMTEVGQEDTMIEVDLEVVRMTEVDLAEIVPTTEVDLAEVVPTTEVDLAEVVRTIGAVADSQHAPITVAVLQVRKVPLLRANGHVLTWRNDLLLS